jgi:hypothetical protein
VILRRSFGCSCLSWLALAVVLYLNGAVYANGMECEKSLQRPMRQPDSSYPYTEAAEEARTAIARYASTTSTDPLKLHWLKPRDGQMGFEPLEYLESTIGGRQSLSLDELKSALIRIDPEAQRLTDLIVRPENLSIYVIRHEEQDRIVNAGELWNAFSPSKELRTAQRRREVIGIASLLYGTKRYQQIQENISNFWQLMPMHTFLWFKSLPNGGTADFIYYHMRRRSPFSSYFGRQLYRIDFDKVKDRTLYTLGDFVFSVRRNAVQAAREKMPDKQAQAYYGRVFVGMQPSPENTPPEVYGQVLRSTFAMSDLRALYLYVFDEIRNTLGPDKTFRIGMPANESIETTIYGGVDIRDLEKAPNGGYSELISEGTGFHLTEEPSAILGFVGVPVQH